MPVTVFVDVNPAEALNLLRGGPQKARYAIVNSMNTTIKGAQSAVRGRVLTRAGFQVRQREFVLREAAVIRKEGGGSGFASVKGDRYEARMEVGQKRRFLLALFEEGGERPKFKGRRIAQPVRGGPARPTWASAVPEEFSFKGLHLHRATKQALTRAGNVRMRRLKTKTGGAMWVGEHRTFLLESTAKAPEGGIFQRVGPGRDDIRMVYSFASHQRVKAMLKFLPTAVAYTRANFENELKKEIDRAFAHAAARTLGFG